MTQHEAFRRAQVIGSWVLLALLAFVALDLRGFGQDVERRLTAIEQIQVERRLTAMEVRLESIETVGKGVLIVVAGQLVLGGLSLRKRRE